MSDVNSTPASPAPVADIKPSAWAAILEFFRPANAGWLRIGLMVAASFLVTAVALKVLADHPEALLMAIRFGLAAGAVATLLLLRRLKMPLVDLQALIDKASATEQGAGLAAIAVGLVTVAIAMIIVGVLK